MDTTSSQLLETRILSAALRLLFFLDKVSNLKFKPNSGNFLNLNLLNLFWGLRLIICPRYLDDYWIPDLNSSPPTETLQTKLPLAWSQLIVRPHELYLLCWEPLISTTNLRFLWRLQNWYMNTYQVSISSIQVGILKEFMYQKSWQPSFLTGSNSFWFALATASVQNGAMEPWNQWGEVGNEWPIHFNWNISEVDGRI